MDALIVGKPPPSFSYISRACYRSFLHNWNASSCKSFCSYLIDINLNGKDAVQDDEAESTYLEAANKSCELAASALIGLLCA